MQGSVPIAFGSPVTAPEGGAESQEAQIVEPSGAPETAVSPEQQGQAEQQESAPVENNPSTGQQDEYQRRWQDTQRALAAREMELVKAHAQVEMLQRMAAPKAQPAPEPPKPVDLAALRQEVDLTPSKMIDIIADRDRYFQEQLARQAMYFEGQLSQRDPEYTELQPALNAIEDMPEAQYLSPAAKLALVKRIKAATGTTQRASIPPTGSAPGQRRVGSAPVQPISNEQRFAPQLRASGAVRDQTKPGVITWQVTREK